jgi:kynurenine formamidase
MYTAILDEGMDISIRLQEWPAQPNAFHAPQFEMLPFRSGDFIGAIASGSPVNFFDMRINPHGNGTHTECARHILPLDWSVTDSVPGGLLTAELISVYPELKPDGDRCISRESLELLINGAAGVDALIVRTLPNTEDKLMRKYSGTNPPYFSPEAIQWISDRGYRHLLTDLPSVDREEDDGKLTAHHIFWETEKKVRKDKTITELIFVNNNIEDGLYLLDIQVINIDLDASPSRPVIYKLNKETPH